MKSFLKYTLATIVGIIVTSVLLFGIGFIILSVIISAQNKPMDVPENSVFMLKLNNPIVERDDNNPFSGINLLNMEPSSELGLNVLLENIEKAGEEENIKGIYLNPSYMQAGWGTVQEIRNALVEFKETGKFIVAYSDIYSQKAFYLSSVADKLYLNPEGMVEFVGLSSEVLFYKEAFEKLGVDVAVFRRGKYKSYAEPFLSNQLSVENREQIDRFLSLMWDNVITDIARSRDLGVDFLNRHANELTTLKSAKHALDAGLIDELKYKDEIINELKSMTGIEDEEKGLPVMTVRNMIKVPKQRKTKGLAKDKIAVIYAQGAILPGEGDVNNIGADRISKAIRKARKDDKIKAIVFRINSGGGSALASEIIWREIKLASETKPVIASMGDVAASGGYYVLSHADTILAEPNTLTGSIGVVAMLYNAEELFNEKLGISMDVVKTNESADLLNLLRPLSNYENQVIETFVDNAYETFITHVADGRELSKSFVDSIGQGRVWNALDAKKLGLVDQIGYIDDAVNIAAEKANIDTYRITELPVLEDPLIRFMKKLSREVRTNTVKKELGFFYKYYQKLRNLQNYHGIQARMPYEIHIE
jgi:protease IV